MSVEAAQNYRVSLGVLWSQPAARAAQMHLHCRPGFHPNLPSGKAASALNAHTTLLGQDRRKASLPQPLEVTTFFQPRASTFCSHSSRVLRRVTTSIKSWPSQRKRLCLL